jgi:hypothetical protein
MDIATFSTLLQQLPEPERAPALATYMAELHADAAAKRAIELEAKKAETEAKKAETEAKKVENYKKLADLKRQTEERMKVRSFSDILVGLLSFK